MRPSRVFRRWMRRVAGRECLVLMYHRVADEASDPFDLCVSPANFADHVDYLAAQRLPVLPLSALQAGLTSGRPPSGFFVTFDDGYVDNLTSAAPALARAGLPWSVFVSSGLAGRRFWWDRLVDALANRRGDVEIVLEGARQHWTIRDEADALRATVEISARLRPLSDERRDAAIDPLEDAAGTSVSNDGSRGMLPGELATLAAMDGVEIGAHTVSHPSLSCLGEDEQRREIVDSRTALEQTIGHRVTRFAYPYGTSRDWNGTTQALLREAGFGLALTTEVGFVERATDPLAVPRFAVRNWGVDELERRLQRFFGSR